eukprot:scaffold922_cov327-Pinguiococcus_pyrenoidosus.AAC.20
MHARGQAAGRGRVSHPAWLSDPSASVHAPRGSGVRSVSLPVLQAGLPTAFGGGARAPCLRHGCSI